MAAILAAGLTVCGVGALVPYISLRVRRRLVPAIFFKIGASMCFILTAGVSVLASSGAQFEQYKYLFLGVLLGAVSGLLGDYWLDMKDMHTEHHDAYVIAGFSSFHLGHVFYIAGLLLTYGADWKRLAVIMGAGLALCGVTLLTEKPLKLRYGKFKGITATYSVLFGMSLAASLCSWFSGGRGLQPLVMNLGLFVFLLSDLVLSGTYFGEGKTRPIDYILNYAFYCGGQVMIALSQLAIIL
jgi:hypothetical protein